MLQDKIITELHQIDGRILYYGFVAGAQRLIAGKDYLNTINVFPTRDADTGNNLAATVQMVMELCLPKKDISEVAQSISEAALTGGHGNSGIIAAQFLQGFSTYLQTYKTIDVDVFSDALASGVSSAYSALSKPVDGTLISVMRDWANEINRLKVKHRCFNHLLINAQDAAKKSLQETPQKLKVLAKAGVVDAGAQGLIYFLDGVLDFIHGKNQKTFSTGFESFDLDTSQINHDDELKHRFCCEAILNEPIYSAHEIRDNIEDFGDSTIVAGNSGKIKIHQHTNSPPELFEKLSSMGKISQQKVDDMWMQNQVLKNNLSQTAILTDTSFSIPQNEIDKHHIHVVPGRLLIGDINYLDTLSINAERVYKLMEKPELDLPTTASPSYKDFLDKYNYLSQHYDSVIAFHGSSKLSATSGISRKAAKEVSEQTGMKITVIDSGKNSAELVLRTCEALDSGCTYEEVLGKICEWSSKIEMIGTSTSLKHALRTGRLRGKGFLEPFKNIKSVFRQTINGDQKLLSISFTEKSSLRKTLRSVQKITAGKKIWGYSITHSNNPISAHWLAGQIETLTVTKARFVNQVSPSIGALVGPGAVAILIMFE